MSITSGFEMTEVERQHSSLKTIINMLIARRWIEDDKEKYYTKVIGSKTDIIDSTQIQCIDKKVAIKFYNLKLSSLKNDRDIDTFISAFPDSHKILIVNEIAPKIEKQMMESPNFEVFRIMEIIRDISTHHLVPKHILLSKEDGNKVMQEYKIKKKDMGRIYIDDPMSRYLYAQKDDIIQIIRETINSGYATYYRLVVVGSIYT
jgi:DNA-directed RNA polymerase subunit H